MTLDNKNVAILTANGALEKDVSGIQRGLIQKRCFPKMVGVGNRLITAWTGEAWGHNFAVDVNISEALGVDYDVLIIPGGDRAITGLKGTEHTRRILNSFMAAGKPILAMNDAKGLFEHFGLSYEQANIMVLENQSEEDVVKAIEWFSNYSYTDMDQQAA